MALSKYHSRYDAPGRKYVFTPVNGTGGLTYESLDLHRNATTVAGGAKTLWRAGLTVDQEHEIFRKAEEGKWKCEDGHFWSFGSCPKGTDEIGVNGEILAKFPERPNAFDPWHGFPCVRTNDKPSVSFIRGWYDKQIIGKAFKKRLLRGDL